MIKKYNCDICDDGLNYSISKNYYKYNSTYGFCDNKKCEEKANNLISKAIWNSLGQDNWSMEDIEHLAGDECITKYI